MPSAEMWNEAISRKPCGESGLRIDGVFGIRLACHEFDACFFSLRTLLVSYLSARPRDDVAHRGSRSRQPGDCATRCKRVPTNTTTDRRMGASNYCPLFRRCPAAHVADRRRLPPRSGRAGSPGLSPSSRGESHRTGRPRRRFRTDRADVHRPWFLPASKPAADAGYDGTASGGTSFGPANPKLREDARQLAEDYRRLNDLPPETVIPVDAVTRSGSGLDPHISPANAALQVPRVARARKLSEEEVRRLVAEHTDGRQFGILGAPRVNVLTLNLALDRLTSR